ncbi:hypothetical protein P7H60_13810 [Vagococcus carniphilus]|uniref:hypothetical protein n=1 Tax=Vagococcus carniphilus TaxID=218144 RepID=UPI00288D4FD9|nr:hypothetical protein [Vagococcus carniphilus]MDT2813830.1 hypothetical protein [Vagococcus carniphilus]MDT2829832.1 hypothetical protein [Vagococcus carniphilus]MDT2838266.1 hypothetical protein [Vagococcus carniphilus]MDT2850225.1 hypothetical protein [Vagococcus carniphilus]MDT2854262.1 hypothetical protein [Vagococcus carniphilus]
MKRKWSTIFLFLSTLFVLTSCGMTQELDESLDLSKELSSVIGQQEALMKDLLKTVEKIQPSFEKDMDVKPDTGLFQDEEGDLYKNFTKRKELLDELTAGQKEVKKFQKEFKRISNKKAVDVDNDKLQLISSSLNIIHNNYDSLILYMNTGFEQEEELYNNLPVDNLEGQGSVIYRTYGSVTMVAEESVSNMEYTASLIKQYEKQAATTKK